MRNEAGYIEEERRARKEMTPADEGMAAAKRENMSREDRLLEILKVLGEIDEGIDRIKTLDLDGDTREEILFYTLAVTSTQPILQDHLTILAWSESGLEVLFQGYGTFSDAFARGVSVADLDGDGVYEILQQLPAFDLDVGPAPREDVAWPSLDRTYDVHRWDTVAGQVRFWQRRREPFEQPGAFEILEEAP